MTTPAAILASIALLSTASLRTLHAQTPPAKVPVHRATTASATPAMSANAPGIPRVAALPKTLFTLRYIDILVGTGELAQPRKWYTVNYTGWLPSGKKFDSSYDRKEPINFPYGARRVIAGWDTGFEGMRIGGKRRLLIPYELAYGEAGNQVIPPKSNLIFDVELLAMSDTQPAPPAPPAGATPSGKPPAPAKPAEPGASGAPAKPADPTAAAPPGTPDKPSAPHGN